MENRAGAAGPVMQIETCRSTTTRTGDFIDNTHPNSPQELLVSACLEVGFKLLPVHGEIIADWATGQRQPLLIRCSGLVGAAPAPPFAPTV